MFVQYECVGSTNLAILGSFLPLTVPPDANAVSLSVEAAPVAYSTDASGPDGTKILGPGNYFYTGDLTELVFTQSGPKQGSILVVFWRIQGVLG